MNAWDICVVGRVGALLVKVTYCSDLIGILGCWFQSMQSNMKVAFHISFVGEMTNRGFPQPIFVSKYGSLRPNV